MEEQKVPPIYCNYRNYVSNQLVQHKHFASLPRDLQFRIRNNQQLNVDFGTVTLIAVENYLNHLYPLGFRLQDSVDTMIQEELGSDRPFIIHSG